MLPQHPQQEEQEGGAEEEDEKEEQPESSDRKEHDTDGQTGEQNLQSDTAVELAGEASERDQAKEVRSLPVTSCHMTPPPPRSPNNYFGWIFWTLSFLFLRSFLKDPKTTWTFVIEILLLPRSTAAVQPTPANQRATSPGWRPGWRRRTGARRRRR